ncbi:hypothetical protein G6660_09075 [Polynucleobacter paneuropaeus]|nr:hypothetical protein [Polynucleobacter paneuropaeus]
MAYTYEISAQEIWLVEKTYKCPLMEAINAWDDIASIHEIKEERWVIKRRLENSLQSYPKGFEIDWGEFPQTDTFKIREIQLVSTTTYSINDNAEDATYCYEDAYESTEPGDYSVLESRFIDDENYYADGYAIHSVELA